MPAGPLPEPVINGGMEEKVRFTTSKIYHTEREREREEYKVTLKMEQHYHLVWK